MSHYERYEDRQIRELRAQLRTATRNSADSAATNANLRRELDRLRNEQNTANANLVQRLEQQLADSQRQVDQQNQAVKDLAAQLQEQERLRNQQIAAMRERHTADMEQLNTRLQTEHQGLRQELQRTRTEMLADLANLRTETANALQAQRLETQRSLTQLNTQLQGQINEVNYRVDALTQQIAAKENGQRELATFWVQQAQRLLQQLQDTFREQFFDTKNLAALERNIRDAHSDISHGLYQSSVTAGRDAFYNALDMKEDLAAAELEWNYWFNAIKEQEAQLLQDLDSANNQVYEFRSRKYTGGVDYWTNGRLTPIRNRFHAVQGTLQNADRMTVQQLQQAEEQLRSMQEDLVTAENTAHTNVAMSISRYEMARKIGSILGANYAMSDQDGEYFNEENRDEYHAIFKNPATDDRIAVVITPQTDPDTGLITNHAELLIGYRGNDAATRDQMSEIIATRLRQEGVANCHFPCAQRYGRSTNHEADRVGDIAAVAAGNATARAAQP